MQPVLECHQKCLKISGPKKKSLPFLANVIVAAVGIMVAVVVVMVVRKGRGGDGRGWAGRGGEG